MNVYDFDGTIYQGDSTVDFTRFVFRKKPGTVRYIPRQIKGFVLYGLKKIEKTQMKQQFFTFLQNIDAPSMVNAFWKEHAQQIFPWYLDQRKDDDVIISASPFFLLQPICMQLGIRHLIASEVDARTGVFVRPNCHGTEKVIRFRELFPEEQIDEFYSDTFSDAPMAGLARKAFLVRNGRITDWNAEG